MSLFNRTKNWGYKVGIFEENDIRAQVDQLIKEAHELRDACQFGNQSDIEGEIGDCRVSLNIIAHMTKSDPDDCLRIALTKIEKRRGKMVNGAFVKDEDEG